jgi:hypothetical protein
MNRMEADARCGRNRDTLAEAAVIHHEWKKSTCAACSMGGGSSDRCLPGKEILRPV